MTTLIFLTASGFCLSLYAFYLERKIRENPNYHPACNISDRVSVQNQLLALTASSLVFPTVSSG